MPLQYTEQVFKNASKEGKKALVMDQEQEEEQGFESPIDLEPANGPPFVFI